MAEYLARAVYPPLDALGVLDDLARGSAFGKASVRMALSSWRDQISAYYSFERAVNAYGERPMFIFEGETWTWKQVSSEVNKLSHYWQEQGLKKGDAVAMIIPNKPTFVILWLSFLAIGAEPAFINYNLRQDSLLHCIKVANAKTVLFDQDVVSNIEEIKGDLTKEQDVKLIEWRDGLSLSDKEGKSGGKKKSDWAVLEKSKWSSMSDERIPNSERAGLTWKDAACYIYTSGTSGLPKAAPCTQAKVATAGLTWAKFSQWSKNDIIYTPLPLYHSSALFLCVAAAWTCGATVVLSRKFSASNYWKEAREGNATVVQYIGEMARFLMSKEPSPKDKEHNVRMAYGNGMRPDVWMPFKERFNVKIINEFYASTEGNTFLFNYNYGFSRFGAGAVGRESALGRMLTGDYLVKVDPEEQEIYRNSKGWCEEAGYNEAGELIIRIDDFHPAKQFHGYKGNKEKTDEKIIQDVFRKGDSYFRTGDLLRRDWHGFFYFEDRLGDTFRWRGENVSTSEVTECFAGFDDLDGAAVYGVAIPKHDGRAGCAAIERDQFKGVDTKKLTKHLKEKLPKYAVPIFLRLQEKQDKTSTEKTVTTRLKKEGIDPEQIGDDTLLILDGDDYREYTKDDWEALNNGKKSL